MKNKLALLVLSIMMAIVPVQAKSNILVTIDNKIVSFSDAQPFMDISNRTLVPIRFVSEALGANVDWNQKTNMVTINQDDKVIELQIGNKSIKVDGKVKQMDTTPISKQNRTFVPLRFVSEGLGVSVDWLQEVSTVKITTGEEIKITHIDELKSEPVTKYGNYFGYKDYFDNYKEVVIVNKFQLPVNVGDYTIYDISVSKNRKEIYITQKPRVATWTAMSVWFSDEYGIRRGRDEDKFEKNLDGTITAQYNTVSLSDYMVAGEGYKDFEMEHAKYFVFEGKEKLLAIPIKGVIQ